MGNSASASSRGPQDETVDYGYLIPQGVYTGPRDWNESVVGQAIVDRKLAPFYRPLEDYDESWDDEKILAARKEPQPSEAESPTRDTASIVSRHSHHKRPSVVKEPTRNPEAAIYDGALECPICFLYYPPNINRSRCCDQAICTECFVQIKRSEPTVTHLVSDPACCPYCVQEHFGVVYTPPPWRAGLGSEGSSLPQWPDSPNRSQHSLQGAPTPGKQKRRKSFGHDDPDVVTIDQIRPDWEAKLAAVRAAATRRANRRIIMRQVGDRLIPVGVTSGRVHALPAELGGTATENGEGNGGSGRRSRRRGQNQELHHLLGGMAGQDLEELMVMEAMRLSLLEHEEQQRREAQQRAQNGGEGGSSQTANESAPAADASAPAPATSDHSTPHPPLQSTPVVSSAQLPSSTSTSTPTASASSTPSPPTPTDRPVQESSQSATATTPVPTPFASSSRPAIVRDNSMLSTTTQETTDSRTGYGPLASDSEESILAQEPLMPSTSSLENA